MNSDTGCFPDMYINTHGKCADNKFLGLNNSWSYSIKITNLGQFIASIESTKNGVKIDRPDI